MPDWTVIDVLPLNNIPEIERVVWSVLSGPCFLIQRSPFLVRRPALIRVLVTIVNYFRAGAPLDASHQGDFKSSFHKVLKRSFIDVKCVFAILYHNIIS